MCDAWRNSLVRLFSRQFDHCKRRCYVVPMRKEMMRKEDSLRTRATSPFTLYSAWCGEKCAFERRKNSQETEARMPSDAALNSL